jgi:hypothetical protein
MLRTPILLILSLTSYLAIADVYQVFEENGKVGLKNEVGQVLLPASFEALGWTDGSFSVIGQVTGYKLGSAWGIVNLRKEFITKAEFESLLYSGGDRIIAFKKISPTVSRYGCIDLTGKITVPFKYDGIKIQGLRAVVFIKNGLRFEHGLIDLEDKEIIPLKFKNIYPIGSLRYAVENFEPKTALFTEQGIKLTEFAIDSISSFRKGKAIIYQELKQGLIDREGEIKTEPRHREIKIKDDGSISARSFDEWKILDAENHEVKKIYADELKAIAKGFYRVTVSNQKGIVDETLDVVAKPIYDDLQDFHFGKMIARRNKKFGVIRMNGSEVLPLQFDSLLWDGQFIRGKENLIEKGWNLYDTFGIKKTTRSYDFLGPYNGKFFTVINKGYNGAINRFGEEFIHCVYDSIAEFKGNQLVVKFQNQYGIISLKEDWLLTPQPYPVKLINEEIYVETQPSITFIKSFTGEIIYFTDNRYDLHHDHVLEYLPDGTEKIVSLHGQTVSRTSLESIRSSEKTFRTTEGLTGIRRDGLYGFIDERGRLRIANRYEDIGEFKDGLAPVKIIGKWGFIDPQDNIAINPKYDIASEFEEGLAIVQRNGKTGIIDKDDKIILPLRYDSVKPLGGQKFLIVNDQKHGLADHMGNVLIEPRFDNVHALQNGYVIVEQGNKFGLLSLDGRSTIPLIYDRLDYDSEKNQFLALRKADWLDVDLK